MKPLWSNQELYIYNVLGRTKGVVPLVQPRTTLDYTVQPRTLYIKFLVQQNPYHTSDLKWQSNEHCSQMYSQYCFVLNAIFEIFKVLSVGLCKLINSLIIKGHFLRELPKRFVNAIYCEPLVGYIQMRRCSFLGIYDDANNFYGLIYNEDAFNITSS